jgi:glycosyltransferase involved in cell wall biosynthesis
MKILVRQFLGKNHSWSVCGWGIATSLIKQDHEVHLFSTDGIVHLPQSLKNNVIGYTEENAPNLVFGRVPDSDYDCQISYTCMKNFPHYLGSGSKNRFGIWCYEWAGKNVLPNGFAKHYKSCDYLCPPSNFAKQVFIDSGISEQNIKVIPHGINVEEYGGTSTIKLPTDKKFKLLANIAQNHLRKNIPGLLEAYGKAFTNKDDVCLILKAKDKPIKSPFEVSLKSCLNNFSDKYPNHAEVKIFSDFVDDISSLYRSIDAVYSLSHCEGFYFPGLEGLAAGKLSLVPGWGGQLDFLNKTNSLLVDGKEVRADPKSMYWESKNNAIWFQPSIEDAANKLCHAYHNYEQLNCEVEKQKPTILSNYSWNNIVSQFLQLCR